MMPLRDDRKPAELSWALYRMGEKVNSREAYKSSTEARAVAKKLMAICPGGDWRIGSYRSDLGLAPRYMADCLYTSPCDPVYKPLWKETSDV